MSDKKGPLPSLITHHSSLITRPMLSHDHRIPRLARVEADGDAGAGEVVGGALALAGVEQLGRLVLDAVDLVVVEDLRDPAGLVGDDVEDGALGDAAGAEQRLPALGLVVGLAALEEVADAHKPCRGEALTLSSSARGQGSAWRPRP